MNIYRIKQEILRSQKGKCAYCGKILDDSTPCDLAHVLPQRKWILNKYGAEIVHHILNMKVTCHNDICNSGVQMSPNKTELVNEHIQKIKDAINEN
jgi:hypothetical protein